MQRYAVLLAAAALTTASLACSVNFGGPPLKTGPTETLTIDEAVPDGAEVVDLTINMAAGQINLSGGAEGALSGEIKDNVVDWNPAVTVDGSAITVDQGTDDQADNGFSLLGDNIINDWTLHLGDVPYHLNVNVGAYDGTLDLSGIPLRSVSINDGASRSEVTFTSANPVSMTTFSYSTGASAVTLTGLGYANADEVTFSGGAGDYTLDLSGDLTRDLRVTVSAGAATVKIEVPASAPVVVVVDGSINDVDTNGTWDIEGTQYSTLGATGPRISIGVEMSVGSLTLTAK